MKIFFYTSLLLLTGLISCTDTHKQPSENIQNISPQPITERNPYASLDQSPMDMIYWPADYPFLKINHTNAPTPIARVIYSRPHKKGRKIFGNDSTFLCRYNIPWRLGANESTEFESYMPLEISGKTLSPGRYTMYAIPGEKSWIIAFNSNIYSWGLQIDSTKDILRVEVPVTISEKVIEDFTMVFQQSTEGKTNLVIAWDSVKLFLPIQKKS